MSERSKQDDAEADKRHETDPTCSDETTSTSTFDTDAEDDGNAVDKDLVASVEAVPAVASSSDPEKTRNSSPNFSKSSSRH